MKPTLVYRGLLSITRDKAKGFLETTHTLVPQGQPLSTPTLTQYFVQTVVRDVWEHWVRQGKGLTAQRYLA